MTALLLSSLNLSKIIICKELRSLSLFLVLRIDLFHITGCLHLLLPLYFTVHWFYMKRVIVVHVVNLRVSFNWPVSLLDLLRHLMGGSSLIVVYNVTLRAH